MRAVDVITKKRDGHPLSPAEITAMVEGSDTGDVTRTSSPDVSAANASG